MRSLSLKLCTRYQEVLLGNLILLCVRISASPTSDSQISDAGYTFGQPGVNATFDYLVVGGGTAGLTVATRLAEEKGVKVAVIEAGGFYEEDSGNLSTIPGYVGLSEGTIPGVGVNALVDWNFNSTVQTVSLSFSHLQVPARVSTVSTCRKQTSS